MDAWAMALLAALSRTALMQMVLAVFLAGWLRRRWHAQPRASRLACVLVLVQGWIVAPLTVAIPWYDPAPKPAAVPAPEAAGAGDAGTVRAIRAVASDAPADAVPAVRTPPLPSRWSAWSGAALRWGGWLALSVWAVGVAGRVLCLPVRYVRFLRGLPPLEPATGDWRDEWNQLLARLGVRRAIPLYVTDDLGPMLVRLPRGPAVLVPLELWQTISPLARQAILRHELAHHLWGDPWKSLSVRCLQLPQWFNPAARWAVQMYQQCGERLCDRFAAQAPAERLHYAQALRQLAVLRLPVHAVGQCAQSHPLVGRVRLLLQSHEEEKSVMRNTLTIAAAGALLLVGTVRVDLVAKEGTPTTKESVEAKIAQFDARLADIQTQIGELEKAGKALKETVDARIAQLKQFHAAGQFSSELVRRHSAVVSGDSAEQVKALDGIAAMGDEGLLLLAEASRSSDEATRRKAVEAALELGPAGYPVLAYALKTLSDADRIFLAEKAAQDLTPVRMLALAALAEDSSAEVQEAVAVLAGESPDRVLLLAVLASQLESTPGALEKLIPRVTEIDGEDAVLLLYAVAKKGTSAQQIVALKTAVARGEECVPVLAAAGKSQVPEVRAEIVRAAKTLGGPVGEYIIQKALADPSDALRQAAEKAVEEK